MPLTALLKFLMYSNGIFMHNVTLTAMFLIWCILVSRIHDNKERNSPLRVCLFIQVLLFLWQARKGL